MIEIDTLLARKEEQIGISAIKEGDRLEDLGFEDQLGEIHKTSCLVEKMLKRDYKIEMCVFLPSRWR